MKKTLLMFIVISCAAAVLSGDDYTWVGTGSLWTDSNNWYSSAVGTGSDYPGAGSNYTDTADIGVDVTISGVPAYALDALTVGGNVTLAGPGSFPSVGTVTVTGELTVSGFIADFFDLSGTLTVTGGDFGPTGNITSNGGSIILSAGAFEPTGSLTGSGITINAKDGITGTSGGGLTGSVSLSNTDSVGIVFTNTGDLTAVSLSNTGSGDIVFTNTGDLTLKSAENTASGGGITIEATAISLDLTGDLSTSNGEITLTGPVTLLSDVTVSSSGGDVVFTGTLNIDSKTLTVTDGDFTTVGNVTSSGGGILLSDSAFNPGGDLTGSGITINANGGITASGSLTGNVSLSNTASGGIVFANSGDLTAVYLSNTNTSSGDIVFKNSGDLTLKSAENTASGGGITIKATAISLDITGGLSSTNGKITLDGPITLLSAGTVSSGGGDIVFTSTVNGQNSGSQSLVLDAGSGYIIFGGEVGSTAYLNTIAIKSDVNNSDDIYVKANKVSLDANVTLNSGSNAISLITDELAAGTSNTINAGAGVISFSPVTSGKAIAFGDSSPPVTGYAYYSSNNITASGGLFIGDANSGSISVTGVGSADYPLTLESGSHIIFTGNYNSTGSLSIKPNVAAGGTMSVTTSAGTIDLGNNALTVDGDVKLFQDLTVITSGGITFSKDIYGETPKVQSLTFSSSGSISLGGEVGSIALKTFLVAESTNIKNPNAGSLMKITAETISLVDGVVMETTSNGSIILTADNMTDVDSVTVDAGNGSVSVAPLTSGWDIAIEDNWLSALHIPAALLGNNMTANTILLGGQTAGNIYAGNNGNISINGPDIVITNGAASGGDLTFRFTGSNKLDAGTASLTLNIGGSVTNTNTSASVKAGTLVIGSSGASTVIGDSTPLYTDVQRLEGAGLTTNGFTALYISNAGSLATGAIGNSGSTTNVTLITTGSGMKLSIDGSITTTNTSGYLVSLKASGTVSQSSGTITVNTLEASGSGGLWLTGNNKAGTVSLSNASNGHIAYTSNVSDGVIISGAKNTASGGSITITDNNDTIKLLTADIEANAGSVTLNGNVTMLGDGKISSGGSLIMFSGAIDSYSAGNQSLTLDAGTPGTVIFDGAVGGTKRLDTLTVTGSNAVITNSGNADMSITADNLELNGNIEINSNDKDISFKLDGGLDASGGAKINAGAGNVSLAPLTAGKSLEYGDSRTSPPPTDVFYSSLWKTLIANSFIVGDEYTSDITLSETGDASIFAGDGLSYALTLQNDKDKNITITGDYKSDGKSLVLKNASGNGSGEVHINGDSDIKIVLGGGAFSAEKDAALQGAAGTVSIEAAGGIVFTGEMASDSNKTHNLFMYAGTNNVSIGGTVGDSANKLGAIRVGSVGTLYSGASAVSFAADIYSSSDFTILHTGTLTLGGGSVTVDGGGFHQNYFGTESVIHPGAFVKIGTTERDVIITTASSSSIVFYNDIILFYNLTLNETGAGEIKTKNIYAYYPSSPDRAWNFIAQTKDGSNYGDITIDGIIGTTGTYYSLATKPAGIVTLTGKNITNASIYTQKSTNTYGTVSINNNNGNWTLKPRSVSPEAAVVIQTDGGDIKQVGAAASSNTNLYANVVLSSGENSGGLATQNSDIKIQSIIAGTRSLSLIAKGTVSIPAAGASGVALGAVTVNGAGYFSMGGAMYASNLTFKGDANTLFDSGNYRLPNVTIDHSNTSDGSISGIILSKNVLQDGVNPSLNIKQGFLDLTQAQSPTNWIMNSSADTKTGFYAGNSGVFSAGSLAAEIRTAGDFIIANGVTTSAGGIGSLSIKMSGGESDNTSNINIANPQTFVFKNFEIIDNNGKGWVTAQSDLYLTGNWTLPTTNPVPQNLSEDYQRFRPGTKGVTFVPIDNTEVQISGDTLWHKLEYISGGKKGLKISFSPYPSSHRVIPDENNTKKGEVTIKGAGINDSETVVITRIGDRPTPPPPDPTDQPPQPPPPDKFSDLEEAPFNELLWVMDVDNAKVDINVEYANVRYSYITPGFISAKSRVLAPWGNGPSWDTFHHAHYCYGWESEGMFMYSFTEDALGDDGNPGANGRIERIRLQCSFPTNKDFSKFFLGVGGGYTLADSTDRPGTENGCEGDGQFVYVYIKKTGDAPDTGSLPEVWLTVPNDSLRALNPPEDPLIDIPPGKYDDYKLYPVDTAPPRIAYSLALPNDPNVYVRFTEPVKPSSLPTAGLPFDVEGKALIANSPLVLINPIERKDESGNLTEYAAEYIIPLTNGFSADDVLNGITYNEDIFKDVVDVPPDPYEWPYPNPGSVTYPDDYDYNRMNFKTFNGSTDKFPDALSVTKIWQPNKFRKGGDNVWSPETTPHRVSDLLVMVSPANADDNHLSIWPLYARDKAGLQDVKPGIARLYDGSETIRNTDIVLENINAPQIEINAPQVVFGVDIPDRYKAASPDYKDNEGLWLTSSQDAKTIRPPYLNAVPEKVPPQLLETATSTINSGRYYTTIPEKYLPNPSILEFIYSITSPAKSPLLGPLYGARIDGAQNGVIPSNWYSKLKTFKINVRGIVYQRSGATILSNVINPTKGEKAVLNYVLTSGGQVTVQVFTLDGVLVQTLFRGSRAAGEYVASWDGKNKGGNIVARGMYFIRIVAPDIDEIRKVMVVK
ncbi:MAG: hypothetical protein LBC27_04580 [Spirochaetaceae bacterium]|jgi:hypothetical protein|nr:hypothetical protein [Spirochaetaceae bacterium]